MSYLDDLTKITKQAQEASAVNPSGSKGRAGYFDWNKHHSKEDANIAIGVILPPYPTYMEERVKALSEGRPFATPFWVNHGLHAIGGRKDNNKFYCNCRKTLMEDNVDGLLSKQFMDTGKDCPVCDVCWGEVWPIVQPLKPPANTEGSKEFKHWKELHKWLCPQQKTLFNWLPLGSTEPLVMDAAQTLGKQIQSIHYDPKQPDLLWPISNVPAWTSAWVQITRTKTESSTTYLANTVYVGYPHVMDASSTFDRATYEAIVSKVPDLRKVCETLVCDQGTMQKALAAVAAAKAKFGMAVKTDAAVAAQVTQATLGVTGGATAQMPPPINVITPPAVAAAAAITPPVGLPPGMAVGGPPPAVGAAPAFIPSTPVASLTADSTKAHAMLNDLLAKPG